MRHDTFILVRAARLEPKIGSYAARRYVERHLWNPNNMKLWTTARILAAAEKAGLS